MTAAKRYAKEHGYRHCRYYRDWYSYHVYIVDNTTTDRHDPNPPCIGYYTYLLTDEFDYWFASLDEMDDISSGHMEFIKNRKSDKIYWVESNSKGEHLFTFDKRKIFNLFRDYPYKLTAEQKEIFDRENPFWKDYFKDRQ